MAKRRIIKEPNEILRKRSKEVTEFSTALSELLDDMHDTLKSSNGVGIAAVQVGVLYRAVLVETSDGVLELINPVIEEQQKTYKSGEEGCLSVPNVRGNVKRSQRVVVKAQSRTGEFFTRSFTGREAVCVLHELDHLDGILFTDRMEQ